MRPSRGMGIVVLVLAGVSGCAGVPQRSRTSSPMEAPTASPVVQQQTGWRGWWSRLRNPAPVPEPAAVTDLRIETSGRIGPERNIWPERNRSILSRLLPSGFRPSGDHGGPTLGSRDPKPSPTMTAAEANRAIASLARPRRKADDLVLPVRFWGDPDNPIPTSPASREAQQPDDEQAPPSPLPTPIPLPGPFMERFSTQPEAKTDEAARNTSAEANSVEDAGPPPLVDQAADSGSDSAPALDSPTATLVSAAQVPPPPPIRPSTRPAPAQTPPPPPITTTPAPPPATEPAKPEAERKPSEDAAPPPSAEQTPEAPTASLPTAPPASDSAAAPSPVVAASQAGRPAPSPTFFAARQPEDSASHRWWFMKWMRPHQQQHEHQHQQSVYASAQGPAQLPPVLVPTSYYSTVGRPSVQTPTQPYVSPTAQQAFVLPSPQSPAPTSHDKKPCVILSRLHHRLEQFRQWKHDHICKHIQSFKEGLAGKHRCHACEGSGAGLIPSAQAQPSPQGRPALPAPQAQAQSQSPFRLGLLAEPGHVAEREQVVERVAAQGLDEAPKR